MNKPFWCLNEDEIKVWDSDCLFHKIKTKANRVPSIALNDPNPIRAEDVRKRIKELEDEAENETSGEIKVIKKEICPACGRRQVIDGRCTKCFRLLSEVKIISVSKYPNRKERKRVEKISKHKYTGEKNNSVMK